MDNVVNAPVTQEAVSEDVKPQELVPSEGGDTLDTTTPAGGKTDPELLLKSLKAEREKRRLLEEEIIALKTPNSSDEEVFSDEGKALKAHISSIEAKLVAIEEEKQVESMFAQYPLLREKAEEFKEFRKSEHPRAKIESVAKLFLAENDMLDGRRKGLEQPTGGTRAPLSSGMTTEDVKRLRETDYRKYSDMLKKGQIKLSS